jgi:uncharacterized membrane protein (UPF0127 family)
MTVAALLLLVVGQAGSAALGAAPELRCLPGQDGFLTMRLRGSIEEEVRWTEPALACEGMSRPDGRGLRLRFAGPRAGGELAVVFAAPELGAGASGKTIPVNVTLLDGAGERIYGTQGDSRCAFDEVEQQPLASAALPPRSYRVNARGFCTAPARAMDGSGAVFVTRFDFAGLVSFGADGTAAAAPAAAAPDLFPALERTELKAETAGGSHRFTAWIADDDQTRARGLMYVRELPPHTGMLFVYDQPQFASFWMHNTYLSLDLIFIAADGTVVNVAAGAEPLSLDPIVSAAPVRYVLEVVAGTAAKIGLKAGDRIMSKRFALQ